MKEHVMFDPSLLNYEVFEFKIQPFLDENSEKYDFYIPDQFYFQMKHGMERNRNEIFEFFENEQSNDGIKKLIELIEVQIRKGHIHIFSTTRNQEEHHKEFFKSLSEEVKDVTVSKIIFEEWVFLQEHSIIVSRIKKPFEKIKDAGAVALEVGGKALKRLARKTLKKEEDEILTKAQYFRAFGKWIALGASSASAFFVPMAAFATALVTGAFMLIDPDN